MVIAVGSRSRYDRDRPVEDHEAAEARAYHTLGELLGARGSLTLDRRALGQLEQVLHATANTLDAGRGVPPQIRVAVRGLAAVLRDILDPRTQTPARAVSTGRENQGAGGEVAPRFRSAP